MSLLRSAFEKILLFVRMKLSADGHDALFDIDDRFYEIAESVVSELFDGCERDRFYDERYRGIGHRHAVVANAP
jgi:DNA replication initiation complex subunit (GINS family)